MYKTFFNSVHEKAAYFKMIKNFSQIYHKNVFRYYNSWSQLSEKQKTSSPTGNHLEPEIDQNEPLSMNSLNNLEETSENTKFYFQIESPARTLFDYCSELRKTFFSSRNEENFMRCLLVIYDQMIQGIQELFSKNLRQRNVLDFNNVFLDSQNEIKLGDLKDLEFNLKLSKEEFANVILRDIEAVTYKLFFEENPFFRSSKRSKNRSRNEILKKIEDFFLKKKKEGKCDELSEQMNHFFSVLLFFENKFLFFSRKSDNLSNSCS